MDVSIIIVNYNTCNLLRNCLNSIFKHTEGIDFEVIVSDNGSKDGSIEMVKQEFPLVILIENNANLGFGTANNRGLEIAKGKYIFYLNSDTILINNAVKLFYDFWETSPDKAEIGALGGNLLDENGNIIHSYGNFPKPWKEIFLFWRKIVLVYIKYLFKLFGHNLRLRKKNTTIQKIGEVEYVTGADLFLLNNKSDYFDERFFLYYEETDLQWHLMKNGLKRLIIPTPKIIHLCGKSDSKTGDGCINDYKSFGAIQTDLSRIRFIKYNISKFYANILKCLLYWFWMTPGFAKKTKKYRKQIFNI